MNRLTSGGVTVAAFRNAPVRTHLEPDGFLDALKSATYLRNSLRLTDATQSSHGLIRTVWLFWLRR